MKKLLTIIFAFTLFCNSSFGQYAQTVKETATAMLKAKEKKDYDAYVDYFYPGDIKMRGGKAAFIKQLQVNDKQSQLMGFNINKKESLGKVSKIYKAGKELQCTIEWNIRKGRLISRWHMLGVSGDQGKTWKFILTAGLTPSQVQAMVPKFNQALTWVDYNEEI